MQKKNFIQKRIAERKSIMTSCLVASLQVLQKEFSFTQEQLQSFSDKYVDALRENLKVK